MLLRSSSTPISASLLSPFSDSPNRDFDPFHNTTSKNHPFLDRICFLHGAHNHPNLTSFSCQNSPRHHSSSPFKQFHKGSKTSGLKSFRRTRSDGNLENLLDSNSCDITEFRMSITTPTESEYKDNITMLHSEPSFSLCNSGFDEFQDDKNPKLVRGKEGLERTVTIGESIEAADGCDDFILGEKSMCLIEEGEEEQEVLGVEDEVQRVSTPPLYLASGLGIDPVSFFEGDGDGVLDLSMENFDESFDMEDYYKRMIDQCPFHPIFLRNYAQLLQSKGDLHGAEEYYSRATLADPDDGELWAQYAKLVWDLHQDRDRAMSYFKLATAVAPQDCHVLAAHASFLWEIDSGEESDEASQDQFQVPSPAKVEEKESTDEHSNLAAEKEKSGLSLKFARGLRIEVPDSTPNDSSLPINVEDHYKKMIEENPNNALVLRNYAQFLYETKGDVLGAEEFYSRAMLTDPNDGEIIAQYAKVVWEFYHDGDKALSYFERAVQAAPENSHVLAAYASFLWENQDDEEDTEGKQEDLVHVPLFHKGALATAKV